MSGLLAAYREAAPFAIDPDHVRACIQPGDRFESVWRDGLSSVPPNHRRGRLCVETGAIAESVATLQLVEAGLEVFGELAMTGAHGVDLLALTPAGQALAVEVKGTLNQTGRPRLGSGRSRQMSAEWLDHPGNHLMLDWELASADIHGAVVHLNFASMQWRVTVSHTGGDWLPVRAVDELLDLAELGASPGLVSEIEVTPASDVTVRRHQGLPIAFLGLVVSSRHLGSRCGIQSCSPATGNCERSDGA